MVTQNVVIALFTTASSILCWRDCKLEIPTPHLHLQEEEEGIGDVDLFTLTEDRTKLVVNVKWLQHLQVRLLIISFCLTAHAMKPWYLMGSVPKVVLLIIPLLPSCCLAYAFAEDQELDCQDTDVFSRLSQVQLCHT